MIYYLQLKFHTDVKIFLTANFDVSVVKSMVYGAVYDANHNILILKNKYAMKAFTFKMPMLTHIVMQRVAVRITSSIRRRLSIQINKI